MILTYIFLQKALLYSLIIFFAGRSWSYYDKISEQAIPPGIACKYWQLFLITTALFSFLLGFAICLELSTSK